MKEPQKGTSGWEEEVLLQVVSTEPGHSFSEKKLLISNLNLPCCN